MAKVVETTDHSEFPRQGKVAELINSGQVTYAAARKASNLSLAFSVATSCRGRYPRLLCSWVSCNEIGCIPKRESVVESLVFEDFEGQVTDDEPWAIGTSQELQGDVTGPSEEELKVRIAESQPIEGIRVWNPNEVTKIRNSPIYAIQYERTKWFSSRIYQYVLSRNKDIFVYLPHALTDSPIFPLPRGQQAVGGGVGAQGRLRRLHEAESGPADGVTMEGSRSRRRKRKSQGTKRTKRLEWRHFLVSLTFLEGLKSSAVEERSWCSSYERRWEVKMPWVWGMTLARRRLRPSWDKGRKSNWAADERVSSNLPQAARSCNRGSGCKWNKSKNNGKRPAFHRWKRQKTPKNWYRSASTICMPYALDEDI